MSSPNPFEALRREASAPGTQTGEPDAKVQTIPAPETAPAVVPKPHKPGKPDVSKAPGDVSYAQTVKEGDAKSSGKGTTPTAAKPDASAPRKNKAGEPLSNEPNFNYAQQHADKAGDKAAEAAQKGKESLHEAGKAAKSAAGESVEAGKQKARQLDAAAGEKLGQAREAAADAADAAREYAAAARDKVAEAGDAVREQAARGVEYVKEHLPTVHVEPDHSKASAGEQASEDLLNDAMALASGDAPPVRLPAPASHPAPSGGLLSGAPTPSAAGHTSTGDARAAPPNLTASDVVREGEVAARDAGHTLRDEALRAGDRASEAAHAAGAKAKTAAHDARGRAEDLAHDAKDKAVSVGDAAAAKARDAAPDELVRRGDREALAEGETPGTLGGLYGAVKGAAGFVRDKLGGVTDAAEHQVHDAGEKFREARAHRPTETDEQRAARYATGDSISLSDTAVDAYDFARARSGAGRVAAGTQDAVAGAKESLASGYETAKDKTLGAKDSLASSLGSAKDKTLDAAQSVADRVSGAAHSVQDSIASAGENARWAVEHTKEQVQKTAGDWQAELQPATAEEALVARGEVPSDTQSILASKGLAA